MTLTKIKRFAKLEIMNSWRYSIKIQKGGREMTLKEQLARLKGNYVNVYLGYDEETAFYGKLLSVEDEHLHLLEESEETHYYIKMDEIVVVEWSPSEQEQDEYKTR